MMLKLNGRLSSQKGISIKKKRVCLRDWQFCRLITTMGRMTCSRADGTLAPIEYRQCMVKADEPRAHPLPGLVLTTGLTLEDWKNAYHKWVIILNPKLHCTEMFLYENPRGTNSDSLIIAGSFNLGGEPFPWLISTIPCPAPK